MEVNKSKTRSSNLELLRIVAMLGIVFSHYHFYLGDIMNENPLSPMSIYHYTIGMGGKIGINIFMLITGYFMCLKEISLEKYVKIILQIYFYNIIIQGLFIITKESPFSISSIIDILVPFRKVHQDDFCTDFIWFYLFIPFVGILIKNITQRQHLALIALSLILYVGYNTLPRFEVTISPVTWFAILMVIASYIRVYKPKRLQLSAAKWGGVTLCLLFIAIMSIIGLGYYGRNQRYLFADCNSLLGFSIAFSVFMTFLNIKLPYIKFVNLYGGAAFGVLLIHSNCWPMRSLIFEKIIDTQRYYYECNYWIPIVSCIAIYIICASIEIIRQKTIEQPMVSFVSKILKKYVKRYVQ